MKNQLKAQVEIINGEFGDL